jgi:aryl-alcohol dehydrogenase-like predicted oxidoreductase
MIKRKLGNSGIEVSAQGLGCMALGGPWMRMHRKKMLYPGQVPENEGIRAIHRAIDLGINFLDTAANYGAGRSEKVVGKAMAGRRDRVILTTKFGYQVDEEKTSTNFYENDSNSNSVVKHISNDCEASLRRLGTDYIDLYLFHINSYSPDKAAAIRDKLEELVAEGKIRYYGWSTDNPEGVKIFAQGKHCTAIEHFLNVGEDAPKMIEVCEKNNLASINHSCLAAGLLSGKYTMDSKFAADDRRSTEPFKKEWVPAFIKSLDAVKEILTSKGRTPVQGALAWIWTRSRNTIAIPGFKTVEQVEENIKAMEFGPLTEDQMREIEKILKRDK